MSGEPALLQLRRRIADLRGRGVYAGYPDRHRCIFIHIPKAAGSAIVTTLFGVPSRHVRYVEYERANPRKFRNYFKFAFVRNPWDRLVSSYFYLRKAGDGANDRTWAERNLAPYADFADFVHNWLSRENIWAWPHLRPQYSYICDDDLRPQMDFIGRVETIEADFNYVRDRLNIDAILQHTNASDHRDYSTYYDDELRAKVGSVYAEDVALFGYEFERGRPGNMVHGPHF